MLRQQGRRQARQRREVRHHSLVGPHIQVGQHALVFVNERNLTHSTCIVVCTQGGGKQGLLFKRRGRRLGSGAVLLACGITLGIFN